MSMMTHARRRHPHRSTPVVGLLVGLAILSVGVAFTLLQFGVIDRQTAILSWPLAFVAVGLVKLLGRGTAQDRLFGLGLLAAGAVLEAHQLDYIDLSWKLVWPALLIFVGLHILAGVLFRRRMCRTMESGTSVSGSLDEHAVFGGRESRYEGSDFKGGQLSATFGSVTLDLTRADFSGDEVLLDARALFGGVEIRVPDHWRVELRGTPIMGGFEDKTRPSGDAATAKRLVISGQAMFGAVEVKN